MTDSQLIAAGTVKLVGSTLTKRTPRDLDLVLVIPTRLFVRLFGSVKQWLDEGETGRWSAIRYRWSDRCVRISHALERRIGATKPVDFKIVPASAAEHGRRR